MKRWKRINNKGQMGPGGEDLIHIVIVVLAIAAILVIVAKTFIDHEIRYAKLDIYRSALINADRISTTLSWESSDVKHTRVLDDVKVRDIVNHDCGSLCNGEKCLVTVIDRKTGDRWHCTGSLSSYSLANVTIKLPVSIRIDAKEFHPGVLDLTLAR